MRVEKETPWSFKRRGPLEFNTSNPHDWSHTMVLIRAPPAEDVLKELTIDERLTAIQTKLDEQISSFDSKLVKQEADIGRKLDEQMVRLTAFEASVATKSKKLEGVFLLFLFFVIVYCPWQRTPQSM
jgi:hypothetical protein